MGRSSTFERVAWMLTVAAVLIMTGWFLVRQRETDPHWNVELQREEAPVSEEGTEDGRPEALLDGEIIDINTASENTLQRLPGIGPGRARAIVAYREKYGSFSDVSELKRVDGIGTGVLESVRPYVSVSGPEEEVGKQG